MYIFVNVLAVDRARLNKFPLECTRYAQGGTLGVVALISVRARCHPIVFRQRFDADNQPKQTSVSKFANSQGADTRTTVSTITRRSFCQEAKRDSSARNFARVNQPVPTESSEGSLISRFHSSQLF